MFVLNKVFNNFISFNFHPSTVLNCLKFNRPTRIFFSSLVDSINDNEFNQWLVGFIDAEGCFSISLDSRKKLSRLSFRFRIGRKIKGFIFLLLLFLIFFTILITFDSVYYSSPLINLYAFSVISLHPNWVTGFSDAEACFQIQILKSPKQRMGWRVRADFSIHLHKKDLQLLYLIQNFFKVGNVNHNPLKNDAVFRVTKLSDLINVIIPHFDKYPLQSAKSIDYLLWKQCIQLIAVKAHLTDTGFKEIMSIKSAINLGLPEQLLNTSCFLTLMVRPAFMINDSPLDPQWVTGFTEGDGSFYVSIASHIRVFYQVGLHKRDTSIELAKRVNLFLNNTDRVEEDITNGACIFSVTRIQD